MTRSSGSHPIETSRPGDSPATRSTESEAGSRLAAESQQSQRPAVTATERANATSDLVNRGVLPSVELQNRESATAADTNRRNAAVLTQPDATPESRLKAAQDLAKAGITRIDAQGQGGKRYSLRLELEPAGRSREMVHVHVTGEDGKERVALRGISRGDGSFEQERNRRGEFVSYTGRAASTLDGMNIPSLQAQQNNETRQNAEGARGVQRGQRSVEPPGGNTRTESGQPPIDVRRTEQNDPNNRHNRAIEQQRPVQEPPVRTPLEDPSIRNNNRRQRPEDSEQVGTSRRPAASHAADLLDRACAPTRRTPGRLIATTDGVCLRSDFDVDVDGSPRARQIDRYGSPHTSWRYSNGGSINGEEVPYIVLPGGKYQEHGIRIGDYGIVRDLRTGRATVGVFADVGPRAKTGEASLALGRELGLNVTPNRGISEQRFEYLMLPGSGEGRARNQQELMQRLQRMKQRLGLSHS